MRLNPKIALAALHADVCPVLEVSSAEVRAFTSSDLALLRDLGVSPAALRGLVDAAARNGDGLWRLTFVTSVQIDRAETPVVTGTPADAPNKRPGPPKRATA